MDDLITCHVCGLEQPPGGRCRDCHTNLLTAAPPTNAGPDPSTVAELVATCSGPRCGAPLSADATECAYCGTPVTGGERRTGPTTKPSAVRLVFPWGEQQLAEGETLVVGRDPLSPLARELASYEVVSRHHAVLRMECDGLHVEHTSKTNPTYVNDQPCEDAVVHPGDRIRFASAVEVRVENVT